VNLERIFDPKPQSRRDDAHGKVEVQRFKMEVVLLAESALSFGLQFHIEES